MAAEDINRIIDQFIGGVTRIGEEAKHLAGPLGGLINPQSSQTLKDDNVALQARVDLGVERQDRLLDTINDRDRKVREVEGERDALRGQNDDLRAELAALKKPDSGRHEGGNAGAPAS